MILFPVFLSTLLLLHSSAAYPAPDPNFFDSMRNFGHGIENGFNDAMKKSGDWVHGAADSAKDFGQGIGNGFNDAMKKSGDWVHGAADSTKDFVSDLGSDIKKGITGLAVKGIKSLDEASEKIANSITKSLNRLTSRVIRGIVDEVKSKLAIIERGAHSILVMAEEKLDDLKVIVQERIQKLKGDLNEWSDEKLEDTEDVSDETRQQITTLLENFVDSATEGAQECANSLIQPVTDLHVQTKKTVEESFPLIDEVVNAIQQCSQQDQTNLKIISKCAERILLKLDDLGPLPRQYSKILSQLKRVASGSLKRAPCIVKTINKIDKRKSQLRKEIKQLIKKDKETPSSTSASVSLDSSSAATTLSSSDPETTANPIDPETSETPTETTSEETTASP